MRCERKSRRGSEARAPARPRPIPVRSKQQVQSRAGVSPATPAEETVPGQPIRASRNRLRKRRRPTALRRQNPTRPPGKREAGEPTAGLVAAADPVVRLRRARVGRQETRLPSARRIGLPFACGGQTVRFRVRPVGPWQRGRGQMGVPVPRVSFAALAATVAVAMLLASTQTAAGAETYIRDTGDRGRYSDDDGARSGRWPGWIRTRSTFT